MSDFIVSLRFNTAAGQAQLRKFAAESKAVLSKSLSAPATATQLQKALASGRAGMGTQFQAVAQDILRERQKQRDPFTGKPNAPSKLTEQEISRLTAARNAEISALSSEADQKKAAIRTEQLMQKVVMRGVKRELDLAKARERAALATEKLREKVRKQPSKDSPFAEQFASERAAAEKLKASQPALFAKAKKAGKIPADQTFDEFLTSRGFSGAGAKRGLERGQANALGISKTATGLLALSSVLAPLNSTLGATAMQAGFAAFSLGPIPAALSLASSALAGFIAVLKRSVATAKEAGLHTVAYARATTELQVKFQAFMNVLGVKTQEAFAPVVEKVSELADELADLPWDELVDAAAAASKAILGVAETLIWLEKKSPILRFLNASDKAQGAMGLEGSQKYSPTAVWGAILGGGPLEGIKQSWTEFREMFQDPKGFEGFMPNPPKFDILGVSDIGRKIQESIFKSEEMDPQLRAIEEANRISKEQLTEQKGINTRIGELVQTIGGGVTLGF